MLKSFHPASNQPLRLFGLFIQILTKRLILTCTIQHGFDFVGGQGGVDAGDVVVPKFGALVLNRLAFEELFRVPFVEAVVILDLGVGALGGKRDRHDVAHEKQLVQYWVLGRVVETVYGRVRKSEENKRLVLGNSEEFMDYLLQEHNPRGENRSQN